MPLQTFYSELRRRSFILRTLAVAIALTGCSLAAGQIPANATAVAAASNGSNPDLSTNSKTWIVRDPATGRLFQQRLVPVSVPVTRWEAKTVEQTVYEPQVTSKAQSTQQTQFVPKTQYVMQPKLRGWWNPLQQPVQAYEYNPVTQWVPQTQVSSQAIIAPPQWVPKQQKIVVYQPVQDTEIRQQLVQVELPQPSTTSPGSLIPGSQNRAIAATPTQPLFRVPFFATNEQARLARTQWPYNQQRPPNQYAANSARSSALPNQAFTQQPPQQTIPPSSSQQTNQPPAQLPVLPPQYVTNPPPSSAPYYFPPQLGASSSGLRPVAATIPTLPPLSLPRFATRPYTAPLRPVTSGTSATSRDSIQSGMQPTVLR